jgi:hypothetical protein
MESAGRVLWKTEISMVVATICDGYRPMGWYLRAIIEHIDHMLDIWNPVNQCSLFLKKYLA